MTGWNMPPGCNVSDIPGNRPEDQKQEAFYDKFCKEFPNLCDNEDVDRVMEWCWKQMGEAYGDGYQQGMADEAAAQEEKRALDLGS